MWRVWIRARPRGAIGRFYTHSRDVEAGSMEEAREKAFAEMTKLYEIQYIVATTRLDQET